MKNSYILSTTAALLVLSWATGCYTTTVAPDQLQHANQHLDELEENPGPEIDYEEEAKLAFLFSDVPEYAELARRRDKNLKLPRLRSAVPPQYSLTQYLGNAKAIVSVAFVLSEEGDVLDARIYEASDARFSDAAVEAVKQWKFYPGRIDGKPAKFLMVVPVHFEGRK